jgi:hypothetical protein
MIMAKSQYPTNPASRDSSRLQAEAIMGKGYKTPGPTKGSVPKPDRASKRQADAWAARDTHSRPITPPELGPIEVDDADVRKPFYQLDHEYTVARQSGDDRRAAEIHAAIGVQKGASSRKLIRGKWVTPTEDDDTKGS